MKTTGDKVCRVLVLLGIWAMLCGCRKDVDTVPNQPDLPYPKLSDYKLFKDKLADLQPIAGVLPYDLNTPLFSDYAEKARFLFVPAGAKATYREDEVIEFPEGTILIKNFFYWLDARNKAQGRRLLETRLLIRRNKEWEVHNYRWNDTQTDAYYEKVGGTVPVSWTDGKGKQNHIQYRIPSLTDCKGCHQLDNGEILPIGPKAANLNKNHGYDTGLAHQLEHWSAAGVLAGAPARENVPLMPRWDDPAETLENRARAYLDVNCAHCHRKEGPASNSGLWLNYQEKNPSALGFCKITVAAGPGSGGLLYGIRPGHADQSILVYRMNSLKAGVMMPELGRTVVHEEGVALITAWINSLPESDCQ